jgi:cysteinyl-tRNA synthetase
VLLKGDDTATFATGTEFPITELGAFRATPDDQIPATLFAEIERTRAALVAATPIPTADIVALAESRQSARQAKEWQRADALRDQLLTLGWQVQDTADGAVLIPVE